MMFSQTDSFVPLLAIIINLSRTLSVKLLTPILKKKKHMSYQENKLISFPLEGNTKRYRVNNHSKSMENISLSLREL